MIVHARVAPKRDTTANWELHADFIPFRGELVIYTDYSHYTNDKGRRVNVPAIKVGDGHTCIADLSFIGGGSGPVTPIRYEDLQGLPTICGKTIVGDLTEEDLAEMGIQKAGDYPEVALTADDIDKIIDEIDGDDTDNS